MAAKTRAKGLSYLPTIKSKGQRFLKISRADDRTSESVAT
jgi:hypothetical protein